MGKIEEFLMVALALSGIANIFAGGMLAESGNDLKVAQAEMALMGEQMDVMVYLCNMQVVPAPQVAPRNGV